MMNWSFGRLVVLLLAERGFHTKHTKTTFLPLGLQNLIPPWQQGFSPVCSGGGDRDSCWGPSGLAPPSGSCVSRFWSSASSKEGQLRLKAAVAHVHAFIGARMCIIHIHVHVRDPCVCAVTVCGAHIKSSRSRLPHPGNLAPQKPPPPGKSTFFGRSTTGVCWTESRRKLFVLLLV